MSKVEGKCEGRRNTTDLFWRGPVIGVLCPPRRSVVVVMVMVVVVVMIIVIVVCHQFHPVLCLLE